MKLKKIAGFKLVEKDESDVAFVIGNYETQVQALYWLHYHLNHGLNVYIVYD